jgi:hypothetical protein
MRKAFAAIVAVVAVLVSAAPAFAQEKLKVVYGLSIPDRVGGLVYARTIDFESKSPGLGYALRFGGKPGWMVDVYLYDLGLTTIPPDAESDVIKNQLAQARGDILNSASAAPTPTSPTRATSRSPRAASRASFARASVTCAASAWIATSRAISACRRGRTNSSKSG